MKTVYSIDASHQSLKQFFRYVLVGLITNLCGYFLYLILTYIWGGPKVTMTLIYSLGALLGFLANRHFTFRHDGHIGVTGVRYLLAQLAGYLLNLLLLLVFVDWLGIAHQIVQGVAIVVVAVFLFIILRSFVFTSP